MTWSQATLPKALFKYLTSCFQPVSCLTSLGEEEKTVLFYLSQNDSLIAVKGSEFYWQGEDK